MMLYCKMEKYIIENWEIHTEKFLEISKPERPDSNRKIKIIDFA